ncbi:MAG: serine/threonine protein kinase [Planctomycetes bacterium]|nr:serine/threonine protein kinase [Planctomycetota bacterium]
MEGFCHRSVSPGYDDGMNLRPVVTSLISLALLGPLCAQDWPAFRGPAGDGIAAAKSAPERWTATTNVKWKVPLARPANGSPIIVKGKVFLTMAGDEDGKRRGLHCYDAVTGKELWVRTAEFGQRMPTHKTNPYCGTTPVSDGTRVVVWHSSAGLWCYDLDGKQLWKRNLGEFRHEWGYGTSPVLHDGKVILNSGPGTRPFVAAFDLETGKTIWKTDEPDRRSEAQRKKKRLVGSWSTPVIARVGAGYQIICPQPTRIVGYDPATGAVVWTCGGMSCAKGDLAYSSPIIARGVCMVRAGYAGPSIGVRLGGGGDVTGTHRAWRHAKQKSNVGSGVFVDGHVYMPDSDSFVSCIDTKTGERIWTERAGRGPCWGSIVYAAGRLYLMNQRGDTVVFRPNGKKLDVIATNSLGERTNSTPVFADGDLFIRTHAHLYRIGGKKP